MDSEIIWHGSGQTRANIKIGAEVDIVLKKDQPTGKLTRGRVKDILTSDSFHPRGCKVRLEDGQVGRVQNILPMFPKLNGQEYQEGLI
ncbi:MAG: YwbE family protein [Candidatus Staskawiczbacteria bacterium]|nr:YwbE family protein [Candidatus Staskawiczbacteria bacterium]